MTFQVHILEQNCTAFDISNVTGVFNLATFLVWLQTVHGARLRAILEDETFISCLRKKMSDESRRGWTAVDQLRDYVSEDSTTSTLR